jgi:hypothetical protein
MHDVLTINRKYCFTLIDREYGTSVDKMLVGYSQEFDSDEGLITTYLEGEKLLFTLMTILEEVASILKTSIINLREMTYESAFQEGFVTNRIIDRVAA